jgi:hypothetical protein
MVPFSVSWIVVIRLLSEVNGISSTRGIRPSRSSFSSPALAAATISAPSVGSPLTSQFSS